MNCEVYCFGEPLAGFYATQERSLSEIGDFHMTWGGDTSNVALATKKLGHQSGYITKIGNDFIGKGLLDLWKNAGVNIKNVFVDKNFGTGMYFVSFKDDAHEFDYKRENSAASKFEVSDIENLNLDNLKVFHLSGISQAISKNCLEASFELMKYVKIKKGLISYDLNYRKKLWNPSIARCIYWHVVNDYADIVSFNEQEAEIMGLSSDPVLAVKELLKGNSKIAVYRRGDKGAILGTKDEIFDMEAFKVDIADTVGAGDTFTAAILVGIIEKMDFKEILRFALAAGACTCRKTGSVEGQPYREEVEKLLVRES